MSAFTHLHVHSHYSLLKALPKISNLVKAAKADGATALALTDLNNMYGAIEFYRECTKHEIKPIIGIDITLSGCSTTLTTSGSHLVLLAENMIGYKNLLKLVTDTHLTEDSSGVVSRAQLSQYAEGLIAIMPAINGELVAALRARDTARAKHIVDDYRSIFDANRFYHELSYHDEVEGHDTLMRDLKEFAAKQQLPLCAAQEIFYLSPEDRRAWVTLQAIDNRGPQDEGNIGTDEADLSLRSQKDIERMFANDAEALKNTEAIAERCSVELTIGKFVFPDFPLPKDKTADEVLRELCMKGLRERGLEGRTDVMERLDYELGIIAFKGYAAYFLVVEDLIRFARENGILYNIRGSVAGSMTTYLLLITKIDPLEYQIPFERFLNPERPSAPDIDMDFADDRREEVIEYARRKYGADHVAQIGTFGTMLARGVVRDVARALGYPYGLGDRIAREVPMGSQGFPMTLERALKENPDLAKIYKNEREAKEIIDLGEKIEGCARHISVHAAGVVISPTPLVDFTPLQLDPKGGRIITQYDMYSVGEDGVGLTKFDFLGIRNLTILANAVELVEKLRGVKVDIENVPLNDEKTFAMLARGETEGTFQLNGSGMTKWLVELKPSTIHDINAMVALYRPGPMQFIPDFIARKHGLVPIAYLDPAMEPILKTSYGILVYQDDLLMMANQLAGYTWGEVDKFRKAVGKKIPEEMAKQKEKFISGCVEHSGWPRKKAEQVWAWIEPFAAYGFNKAHSASYGKVAYQTAYMKANFPVEYMTAVMTAESGDVDTIAIMVNECKRMGIPILAPDVNESFGDFTAIIGSWGQRTAAAAAVAGDAEHDAIRFGLYSIKNFGEGVADSVIAERKRGGRFTSLSDFLRRVKDQTLNKKSLEALVMCGALDSIGSNRGEMLANMDRILEYHKHASEEQSHDSLFASLGESESDIVLTPAPDAPIEQKLAWEKELLGLFVSGHPLDRIRERLAKLSMNIAQIRERVRPGIEVITAGMIEDVRIILTKGGDHMAFIKITDYDGSIEAVVFPKTFAQHKDVIRQDACVALRGKLSSRNNELSIAVDSIKGV
ncbi:MAG TPA: DNA polymerase III subunit alpha [Candidatus Paceibacterota bacterium]